MREYKVEVTRDGRWWMVSVPGIDGLTQARRVDEIEDMACSLIAVSTDTPLADVGVHVVSIVVPGVGEILGAAHHIADLRRRAEQAQSDAAMAVQQYAKQLTRGGIPVRDTAALIGVSPQRVSQLANAS
ncbi:hypothetical protein [Mycobacterium lacus]|uniref:Uncharacterized protein n=2 Tax=Mycobacterium lacus TaxID=169765 RepID=A0A1X1XIM6_9MYCO|nr:hypothetical protein [Mycobacterium lacus]MCV7124475.1 HicB family toxin-antitoxin system [Mycobacterium lacus]ORV98610.1 hypothetical protein AWC15_11265 [Mycobacterium lacus]BBX97301.1 hypothetical protein MLAC_25950 [Mycobacterium lacus]